MSVVHYHSAHSTVDASLFIEPKPYVNWAVVGLIVLVQVNSLLDRLDLIVLLASADQMKAVHACFTFLAKTFVAHLELALVPKTVLVVGRQGLLWCLEFSWERRQVDKVRALALQLNLVSFFVSDVEGVVVLKVIKFAIYFFVDWLVDPNVLFSVVLLVEGVNVVHDVIVHGQQTLILVKTIQYLHFIHLNLLGFFSLVFLDGS